MQIQPILITAKLILSNGQNLLDFEKQSGKKLLNLQGQLQLKSFGSELPAVPIKIIHCSDSDLNGYFCFDFSNVMNNNQVFNLFYDINNQNTQKLDLILFLCQQEIDPSCEQDQKIINSLVYSVYSYLQIDIRLNQFNTVTKQIETNIKQEQFYFDQNLIFLNKFILKKSDSTVDDGFILSNKKTNQYFSDYSLQTSYISQQSLNHQNIFKSLGGMSFQLGQHNYMNILRGNSSTVQNKTQEEFMLQKIVQQAYNSFDIYELQKELLKIKMMLKLLVTEKQYAAIQFCGSSIQSDNSLEQKQILEMNEHQKQPISDQSQFLKEKESSQKTISDNNNISIHVQSKFHLQENRNYTQAINLEDQKNQNQLKNHLEKLDQIDEDQNILIKYLELFLSQNGNYSELDLRIFDCIIGQRKNQKSPLNSEKTNILEANKKQA
ncbi:hypothetical protein ABPG74_005003 [Tetrahymena malaccensis]